MAHMVPRSQHVLPLSHYADDARQQVQRIRQQLRSLGAVWYDFLVPETHSIPLFMHTGEDVLGVVYGRYKYIDMSHSLVGRGVLVATNERVLLVDKKPFYTHCDEIPYRNISGITYGRVGFMGTIMLFTKIGTISIRTFNRNLSQSIVEVIEENIFKAREGGSI